MPAGFRVNITGLKETQKYLRKVEKRISPEGVKTTHKLAKELARRMRIRTSHMKSGRGALKKSIVVKRFKKGNTKGWEVSVGGRLKRPYHLYQEYGFKPHAVTAKMLRKQGRAGTPLYGHLMTRKSRTVWVKKYTPFIEPSIRGMESKINQEVNRLADRIVRR